MRLPVRPCRTGWTVLLLCSTAALGLPQQQGAESSPSSFASTPPAAADGTGTTATSSAQAPATTTKAYSYLPQNSPLPGLPANGIRIHDVAIGVLPDWSREGPRDINAALGAGVSIIGDYLNVYPASYDLSQVDWHLPEVRRIASGVVQPVYAPAIIYHAGLDTWSDDITQAIADKMKSVNDRGIKVWLRLLFEMNGYWMDYGLQPGEFVRIWRDVTDAVRAKTNETYMLWAPNIWAGDVGDSSQGYVPYWPGEQYVDVAGLSYYWQGYQKYINQPPPSNQFRDLVKPFHDLLNPRNERQNQLDLTRAFPICITETSAPYYYDLPPSSPIFRQAPDTDVPASIEPNLTEWTPSMRQPPFDRADDELYIKATWFVQMTSNSTVEALPNLKAVSLFNYLKRGGGEEDVLADFRSIGGNSSVEGWFRGYMGNQTAFELGYTGTGRRLSGSVALLAIANVFVLFMS